MPSAVSGRHIHGRAARALPSVGDDGRVSGQNLGRWPSSSPTPSAATICSSSSSKTASVSRSLAMTSSRLVEVINGGATTHHPGCRPQINLGDVAFLQHSAQKTTCSLIRSC